jgi:predicted aspartyl protease
MDKLVPIIYMIGVLLLVLPSFLSSNNNLKTFFTNLSIWIAIVLVVLSLYFAYNYFLWFIKSNLSYLDVD